MHTPQLSVGRTRVQIRLQRSSVSTSVFGEYRSPRVRTISEVGSSRINMTEVVLTGVISLEDINDLLQKVGMALVSHLEKMHENKQHFAVLLGHPNLTPFAGEASGARIELDEYVPTTLVSHDGVVESELDWILPTQEIGWFLPNRPRVSQADWIKWYSLKHDICLDVTVISSPSDPMKWMIEEQRDFFAKWWNESLFMQLPANLQDGWEETQLPKPSYWYHWDNERSLAVWLHPIFNSPIVPLQVEPDHEPLEPFPFQPDLEKVQTEIADLRAQVEGVGGVFIEPLKARHMIALLDEDPSPTTEIIEYQSRHLVFESEIVPSPIDPNSRRVRFTVCWSIEPLRDGDPLSPAALQALANELTQREYNPFGVTIEYDDRTISKQVFLIGLVEYLPAIGFERTVSFLQRIEESVEAILHELENAIKLHFNVKRATGQYWDKEIFMTFGRA